MGVLITFSYEKLKHDVLPELHKLTDDFKEFESGFIEKVTKLREAVSNLDTSVIDVDALKKTEELSKSVFSSFKVTAESYPELGATSIVSDLMSQIADKNENVAAITIYNRGVEQFNNSTIQQFNRNGAIKHCKWYSCSKIKVSMFSSVKHCRNI